MPLNAVVEHPAAEELGVIVDEASGDALRRAVATYSAVAATLVRSKTLDELLRTIAREMSALVAVDRCTIYLRDGVGGTFRGRVGRSGKLWFDDEMRRLFAGGPADGLTHEMLKTRRPVVVRKADDDARTIKSTVRLWKIRSIMIVPMLFGGEVVGVVSLDDVGRSHQFIEQDGEAAMVFARLAAGTVVGAHERATLGAELDGARRQVKALQRAAAVDERLSELALRGRSMRHLLDVLAELLGKPCAYFDSDGARVATAVPPGTDASVLPRLLEPDVAGRPGVREALAAQRESRAFVVGPLPTAGVVHRHVVAPIVVEERLRGHLVMIEHGTRFTFGDIASMRRAAALVGVQLDMAQGADTRECDVCSSLVAEMLAGSADAASVGRRATQLGVRLDVPRAVLLLTTREPGVGTLPSPREAVAALRRIAPEREWHAATIGEGIAVLAELRTGTPGAMLTAELRAATEALMLELPSHDQMVGGISCVHEGLPGIRRGLDESRQVVECIRRFAPAGRPPIRTADELGIGRLLLATSDANAMAQLAEDTFGDLVRDPTKTDLLTTLVLFFDQMGSARRTAESLSLHENSVRYRLTRIEDLTGLSVTHDPESQMHARLALLVLLLQGRLPTACGSDNGVVR